jgi:hypothetical protein
MHIDNRAGRWPTNLAWAHAGLFGAIALGCYLSPETMFGDSVWLPLPRLAVLLFGAALTATVIVLIGSARSGSARQTRLALLAALVLDAQVPILAFSQPASLEYLETGLGIPWFVVPLAFVLIVGATVPFTRASSPAP